MATATLKADIARVRRAIEERTARTAPALTRLHQDPARLMDAGLEADPWQKKVLRSRSPRTLLLCSRQAGKSTVAAALALRTMLLSPPALVLLLSPTLRQSSELFRKVLDLFNALGRPVPVVAESALRLELANGSRAVSLPGMEATVRGYSGVDLLIIDEAARVLDPLYYSVRPMLAVSRGQLVCLSTPFGKRGWFYDEWTGAGAWERVKVTAKDIPRITPTFLEEERQSLGERWYNQEYLCSFEECIGAVFADEDLRAALTNDIEPLLIG